MWAQRLALFSNTEPEALNNIRAGVSCPEERTRGQTDAGYTLGQEPALHTSAKPRFCRAHCSSHVRSAETSPLPKPPPGESPFFLEQQNAFTQNSDEALWFPRGNVHQPPRTEKGPFVF